MTITVGKILQSHYFSNVDKLFENIIYKYCCNCIPHIKFWEKIFFWIPNEIL